MTSDFRNALFDYVSRFLGVVRFLWTSTRGYRLRPWASPYLRWRIETYWGWPAESIDAWRFWSFTWRQRRELFKFLLWVGSMRSAGHNTSVPSAD